MVKNDEVQQDIRIVKRFKHFMNLLLVLRILALNIVNHDQKPALNGLLFKSALLLGFSRDVNSSASSVHEAFRARFWSQTQS